MSNTLTRIVLATLIVGAAAGTAPVEAGGYVGLEVSNHGVSVGFGSTNWGIWGSSWNSGAYSAGFTATLDGYGEWVHVAHLGRVWRPWVSAGWQPYTHGRWTWTSMGWTWVAYEPWGWVPHHYGNWAYSTVGWVWSPGYAYHPGNVVWVSSGVHLGWYPYGPTGWSHSHRGYQRGWHRGYASGHRDGYSRGYEDGWRDARYATWVPRSRVTADNVAHHVVGHDTATRGVARSRVTTMSASPTRAQIERSVGRPVPEVRIVERKTRVDGHDLRMVRPEGMERTVQRHGASTVTRALSPEARPRATRSDSRATSDAGSTNRSSDRQASTVSRRAESKQRVDTRRRSSTAGLKTPLTKSATTATRVSGSDRGDRPASQSARSSQPRSSAHVSAPRRTTRKTTSNPGASNRVQASAPSGSGQQSVTRQGRSKAEPTSVRTSRSGRKPEPASASSAKKAKERKATTTSDEKKRRRRPSRD